MKPVKDAQLLGFGDLKLTLLRQLNEDCLLRELQSLSTPRAETEDYVVQEWLTWCLSHPDVQLVDANVPPAIIPGAALVDIKAGVGSGRRRQRDDVIYNENEDIRRRVARGNCVLRLPGQRCLCLIHALKKFTGGMGDEDDDSAVEELTWRRYFVRPVEAASRIVLTQKANGEAAHLSARHVNGAFLVCVGSKNVHMVLRSEEDIALYGDSRYRVAREVAAVVWRLLAAMEDDRRQLLLSFLHHTRFTAVMELLQPDHQSVEDLSDLKEAELRFIAWAPTFSWEFKSFCGCSPELGFHLAETLGLKAVEHSVVTGDVIDRLPQLMQEIKEGWGYEGKVIYFVDDYGNVIGLLKKKTTWYILLRALRDLLCSGLKKLSFENLKTNIERKFRAVQAWHGVTNELLNDWLLLSVAFTKWLKSSPATDVKSFRTVMPTLWNQFLRKTGRTDKL